MKRRRFIAVSAGLPGIIGSVVASEALAQASDTSSTSQADQALPPSPAINRGAVQGSHFIAVSEQGYATPYDRLRAAIDASMPGDTILGEEGQIVAQPASEDPEAHVRFRSHTRFLGNGTVFRPSGEITFAVGVESNASNVELVDCVVDCSGSNDRPALARKAGIFIPGGHNIWLVRPQVRNFSAYAIHASATENRGLNGIHMVKPRVHSPALGSSFGLFAQSKAGTPWSANVYVEGGDLWGTDPRNPTHGDYDAENSYTGDYITFHGVRGGHINNTAVRYSGSAAITLSRGSENILVSDVLASVCYEPAVNAGSGFLAIHVADLTGFTSVESVLAGPNSVEARIVGFRADKTGQGGWIWLAPVRYGVLNLEDEIALGEMRTVVTAAPESETDAGEAVIASARNISLRNITALDTVIQGGAAVFNFIHARGADTIIQDCHADDPRGLGQAKGFLSRVHSDIGFGYGNTWRNRAVDDELISAGGSTSNWNYLRSGGLGFIGSGRMTPSGRFELGKNMTCERLAPGRFYIRFSQELESGNYRVVAEAQDVGHYAQVPPGERTEKGFALWLRSYVSSKPVDGMFAITVLK